MGDAAQRGARPGTPSPLPVPAPYGSPEDAEGAFQVLIEQTVGSGDSRRWTVEPLPDRTWPSRGLAAAAAEHVARTFTPRHPMSERARSVYRVTPDQFIVVVQGMTQTSHFRVSVAERLG